MKSIYKQLRHEIEKSQYAVLGTELQGEQGQISEGLRHFVVEGDVQKQVLEAGKPMLTVEGDQLTIMEPFFSQERLIIFGGGHIARPLVSFAARVGFQVTVIDDRPSFANSVRFREAKEVICKSFATCLEDLEIHNTDYVVVITRGHRHDQVSLEKLFEQKEPVYTGMIGSKRRVKALKELLKEEGLDGQRLERIHTPIGLSIGAVTPEEIAISIMAEIISCKRLGGNDHRTSTYINRSDVDSEVMEVLEKECHIPKAIVTIIEAKGSVPRGVGAKMLVYSDGRLAGSIGGGCSEGAVIQTARNIIGTGSYKLVSVDMTGDVAEDEGMVCGGRLLVLIEDDLCESKEVRDV